MRTTLTSVLVLCSAMACAHQDHHAGDWRQQLATRLPIFGHRNWIVVADAAYPAQSSPGIETIWAGGDQIEVARAVLAAIDATSHVRAKVWLDGELAHVPEADAPGIARYRTELAALLRERPVQQRSHEEVIHALDAAARTFAVLIIKTSMTLPYTSVFLELDCGYWGPAQEQRMRAAAGGEDRP